MGQDPSRHLFELIPSDWKACPGFPATPYFLDFIDMQRLDAVYTNQAARRVHL